MGYIELILLALLVYYLYSRFSSKGKQKKASTHTASKTISRRKITQSLDDFSKQNAIVIGKVAINQQLGQIKINKEILNTADIISYTPHVDAGTKKKHHGLTRAAAGGLLFGGAGAVVGAVTGGKQIDYVHRVSITIVFRNGDGHTVDLLAAPIKTDSLFFKNIQRDLDRLTGLLDNIIKNNTATN